MDDTKTKNIVLTAQASFLFDAIPVMDAPMKWNPVRT
jgi:hypothetical protein